MGSAFTSHLVCHSDCEGYYVPVDFGEVLFPDERLGLPDGMVGSSVALMRELVYVAPYLGITLADGELSDAEIERIYAERDRMNHRHPFQREQETWFMFYEAARGSIENGTLIQFG